MARCAKYLKKTQPHQYVKLLDADTPKTIQGCAKLMCPTPLDHLKVFHQLEFDLTLVNDDRLRTLTIPLLSPGTTHRLPPMKAIGLIPLPIFVIVCWRSPFQYLPLQPPQAPHHWPFPTLWHLQYLSLVVSGLLSIKQTPGMNTGSKLSTRRSLGSYLSMFGLS